MEARENYWGYTEKQLIEHMRPENMDPGSPTWIYLSNILHNKYAQQNTLSTKNLGQATWGLAIITGLLVFITIVK